MQNRLRPLTRRNFNEYISEEEEDDEDIYQSTSSGIRRHMSQSTGERQAKKNGTSSNARISGRNALSQGSSSLHSEESDGRLRTDSKSINLQEEIDLAGRVIRYIFTVEKKKHVIQKIHIIKNILGGTTKNFRQVIERVKSLLSQVFGYQLVDIGNGKYILVNEIKNSIPHLKFTKSIKAQQVLLFIILAHIFMYEDACTEETLWDFLRHLEIIKEDDFQHDYFGDVKKLVTVDFVGQQYLEKVAIYKGDSQKYEYKWGPRAEYEVSHRDILEFMSRVYEGRSIESWPLHYQMMLTKERSGES
ncbi:non-structural maintenance of chromosomes element 3 homolog [Vespa mandarinia]|uniref:non-structural maintenance of chromosomes element 3 homolog n=1 Tax=Vespa mandarinia TaxID=7446 RepID=UPI0016220C19|nr:non-structural maintenance of chromosomes element 3 homolog [Vespa mandarinia]